MPVKFVVCSYKNREEIAAALAPYRDQICGVVCRGDRYIQYLRRVAPLLPAHVPVASVESLAHATNKRLMRSDFMRHFPEITPRFLQVHDASAATLTQVEHHLTFPVIAKPADLSSSVLIQLSHTKTELRRNLQNIFQTIHRVYEAEGREGHPELIVEEYLEGDFYSIDAYVRESGEIYFCPPVAYIPAKQLGIDDFFLYKRFVPTTLAEPEVQAANEVTAKAIQAVGLQHTSVHAELVRTSADWRVIELGPRLGRFRQTMYLHAYGLDHSLNDVLIHVGQKPRVTNQLLRYCAAYSIYPRREGKLRGVTGLHHLKNSPHVSFLKVNYTPGQLCLHAKNGGHAVAEFVIATEDKAVYNSLERIIEEEVEAIID